GTRDQRPQDKAYRQRVRAHGPEGLSRTAAAAWGSRAARRLAAARIHLHGYALGRISHRARARAARPRCFARRRKGVMQMRRIVTALAGAYLAIAGPTVLAHHSFAIYDM